MAASYLVLRIIFLLDKRNKQGFIKSLKLIRTEDFRRVFSEKRRLKQGCLLTYTRLNSLGYPRLGFSVTKKAVPKAVSRNRLKRIIRESFRLNLSVLPCLDIVIVVVTRLPSAQILLSDLNKQWSSLVLHYKRV